MEEGDNSGNTEVKHLGKNGKMATTISMLMYGKLKIRQGD